MIRPLNSDELGEKGEKRFAEICADTKLICNSSYRDRTGWDFVVEFQHEKEKQLTSFDKRAVPRSCHTQVKTIWSSNTKIRIRLSSLERLAKEPKPSFIYIFRVNNQLDFEDSILIHLLDSNLAMVLERLRAEAAKGTEALNKEFATLNVNKFGQRIAPTGFALRTAIQDVVEEDIESYINKKAIQMKALGFPPKPYETDMTLIVNNEDEFVDAFLGLRKIPVQELKITETRFGIKLIIEDKKFDHAAILEVSPEPGDKAQITFRSSDYSTIATFSADVYSPAIPGLAKDHQKILIKCPFFQILMTQKDRSLTLSTNAEEMQSSARPIDEWINLLKLFIVASKGDGSLTISSASQDRPPLTFSLSNVSEFGDYRQHQYTLKAFEAASHLLRIVGASNTLLKFNDIAESSKKILEIKEFTAGKPVPANIKFEADITNDAIFIPESEAAVFVNFQYIGSVVIAYSLVFTAQVIRHESHLTIFSKEAKLHDLVEIKKFPENYFEFVESARKLTPSGINITMQPEKIIEGKLLV